MPDSLKKKLTQSLVGEPIRDWGVVFEKRPGFFTEQLRLALFEKPGKLNLGLTYAYKSPISFTTYTFVIPVYDLESFVSELRKNYAELATSSISARTSEGADKLPLAQRMMIKVIHGIRSSKLLLDLRDPRTRRTEYRFHGYVTRKGEIKIFIQSELDMSQSEGHVVSGEGLEAALRCLSEYIGEANQRSGSGVW